MAVAVDLTSTGTVAVVMLAMARGTPALSFSAARGLLRMGDPPYFRGSVGYVKGHGAWDGLGEAVGVAMGIQDAAQFHVITCQS